ncbi:MAG: hypothetical protein QM744_04950 [Mesorhizobium sp.]
MLRGDLGQSPGGWPKALQKKALKGDKPYTERPGALLKPADLKASRKDIEREARPRTERIRICIMADVSEGLHGLRSRAGNYTVPSACCRRQPISTEWRQRARCLWTLSAARRW